MLMETLSPWIATEMRIVIITKITMFFLLIMLRSKGKKKSFSTLSRVVQPTKFPRKSLKERLGKPCNRGKPPSEYTDGKTFWVSTSCPSFALGGNKAPKPEVLYTPRMFLWFPQYLMAPGKKLNCCKSGCGGHLNVKGFTPKARRVIDIKE